MTTRITPEMIAAWRTLQESSRNMKKYVNLAPHERRLMKAIDVLDNSDYMVPIERAEEDAQDAATLAAGGEVRMVSIPLSELTGEGLARALRRTRGTPNER